MNIKEKILQVLEYKHIKKEKFFTQIGITYSNFTGAAKETPIRSDTLSKILTELPDVSAEWLLRDEGNMIRCVVVDQSKAEGCAINGNGNNNNHLTSGQNNDDMIILLKEQIKVKDDTIQNLLDFINSGKK